MIILITLLLFLNLCEICNESLDYKTWFNEGEYPSVTCVRARHEDKTISNMESVNWWWKTCLNEEKKNERFFLPCVPPLTTSHLSVSQNLQIWILAPPTPSPIII